MRIHRSMSLVVCAAATALLAGCGGPLPGEANDCPTTFEENFPEKRAVEIGYGEGESFVPYHDGDDLPLRTGGQGATMVTPMLRVAGGAPGEEEGCYRVRLSDDAYPGPDGENTNQANVVFVRAGEWMVSDGEVFHPFTVDDGSLVDSQISLTATVQGEGFEGSTTVTVLLH